MNGKLTWADPDKDCPICRGNPYWGKTLSSWTRCECVKRRSPEVLAYFARRTALGRTAHQAGCGAVSDQFDDHCKLVFYGARWRIVRMRPGYIDVIADEQHMEIAPRMFGRIDVTNVNWGSYIAEAEQMLRRRRFSA